MLLTSRSSRWVWGVLAVGLAGFIRMPLPAEESPLAGIEGAGSGNLLPANLLAGTFGGGGAQAAQTPPPAEAKKELPWGGRDSKGFFVQSTDGKFRLQFMARIQARYTYFGKDAQGDDTGEEHDESYFELERARIGMTGHFFDPSLRFKIEMDGETDASDKGALTDAYVDYAPFHDSDRPEHDRRDYVALGIGQFKPYFLRQEATSSGKQQRVDRSLSNEFFNIDRNIGIWAQGFLPSRLFFYHLAVTNGIDTVNIAPGGGSAQQVLDQNPAFIGKLDVCLLGDHTAYSYEESDVKISKNPLLVVGGSVVHERYDPAQRQQTPAATAFINTRGKVTSFGGDAIFKYAGLSLEGEYVGRWYDQDGPTPAGAFATGEAIYCHGWNLQGGYFILPKELVELTFRYSEVRGNEGPQNGKSVEIGPGINWFFSGSHNAKVQLDVAWVNLSDNLPSNTESLRQGPNVVFGSSAAGFHDGEQGVLTRFQVQVTF
jgi:hypothetical protein